MIAASSRAEFSLKRLSFFAEPALPFLKNYCCKAKAIAVAAGFLSTAIVFNILWERRDAAADGFFRKRLKVLLETKMSASPVEETNSIFSKKVKSSESVIYVLGGTQESLILKFRTAIGLCGLGTATKIMLLSTPGITEYDEVLGRNLTNDEWALKELSGLRTACSLIEFIRTDGGFFGTLSEAKAIRKAVLSEGICSLTLVCSGYHSRRVKSTFSRILNDTGVSIRIQIVDEVIGTAGLLTEWLKLFIYENLLLPWQGVNQDTKKRSYLVRGSVAEAGIGVR